MGPWFPSVLQIAAWNGPARAFRTSHHPWERMRTGSDHANLGFFQGALLDDPDRLVERTGRRLRPVKLDSLNAVARARLVRLLKRSATLAAHG